MSSPPPGRWRTMFWPWLYKPHPGDELLHPDKGLSSPTPKQGPTRDTVVKQNSIQTPYVCTNTYTALHHLTGKHRLWLTIVTGILILTLTVPLLRSEGKVKGERETKNRLSQKQHGPLEKHHSTRTKRTTMRPVDIGTMDHTPLELDDFYCIFHVLLTDATKPYYVHDVKYYNLNKSAIYIDVVYQSVGQENVTHLPYSMTKSDLTALDKYPSASYCNKVWSKMLPNYKVHVDKIAFDQFQAPVIRARQIYKPKVCVTEMDNHERVNIVGFTDERDCPIILTLYPIFCFPRLDHITWMCGNQMYSYIPSYWSGRCAPYWSDKRYIMNSNTTDSDVAPTRTTLDLDGTPVSNYLDVIENEEVIIDDPPIRMQEGHPYASNTWYKIMRKKVRKLTTKSCYACSLLPQSTEELFHYWTTPLNGPNGLPSLCVMTYIHMLLDHPLLQRNQNPREEDELMVVMNSMDLTRTNVIAVQHEDHFHPKLQYLLTVDTSIRRDREDGITDKRHIQYKVPPGYPSLMACSTFYRKHMTQIIIDLVKEPTTVSARNNESSIYDLCVQGDMTKPDDDTVIESLNRTQCATIYDDIGARYKLAETGIPIAPNFYWCCGKNVWTHLPPNFKGLCGLCTINDLIFIVQPTEYLPQSEGSVKTKRHTKNINGYIPLKFDGYAGLPEWYHNELGDEFKLFTQAQMFFKSAFSSTELQYANHYIIALTRHDVFKLANFTASGFTAVQSEFSLVKHFMSDNRLALDALTASQGGVCAIVGNLTERACCTYLPSESEGLGNLTNAIKNIMTLQSDIINANKGIRLTGGYLNMPIMDGIAKLFRNNPWMSWVIGIMGPLITIVIVATIVVCVCFPIFKALILKSIKTITSMPQITNNRNADIEMLPFEEMEECPSVDVTSSDPDDSSKDDDSVY